MSASRNKALEMQDDGELRWTIKRSYMLIVLAGLVFLLSLDFLWPPISIDYKFGLRVLGLVIGLFLMVYFGLTARRAKKLLEERLRSSVQGPTNA